MNVDAGNVVGGVVQAVVVVGGAPLLVGVMRQVRARLEVPPTIGEDELRELALAAEGVRRSLDGREIAKIIVRAPKLVSIVPA